MLTAELGLKSNHCAPNERNEVELILNELNEFKKEVTIQNVLAVSMIVIVK